MGGGTDGIPPGFFTGAEKNPITFSGKREEVGNIVSFSFSSPSHLAWKAGQHGIISLPGNLQGGSWRGFSIASDPDSGEILISTRISDEPSAFKRALMDLKPGDQVSMRGPFGPFYLDGSERPAVFIAGGIGITPYRSLVHHWANKENGAPSSLYLLYSDDRGEYAYRDEFTNDLSGSERFKAEYVTSRSLTGKIGDVVGRFGNGAQYFISGPPKMVVSMKKTLVALGVKVGNIRHEPFLGL